LLAALPGRYVAAVERRVRTAIEFVDGQAESAGESYSRGLIHAAGFVPPALQREVRDSAGRVGYSDFYWEESRIVGEFDGIAKYQKPDISRGSRPGRWWSTRSCARTVSGRQAAMTSGGSGLT
jgi:hypothetical protein